MDLQYLGEEVHVITYSGLKWLILTVFTMCYNWYLNAVICRLFVCSNCTCGWFSIFLMSAVQYTRNYIPETLGYNPGIINYTLEILGYTDSLCDICSMWHQTIAFDDGETGCPFYFLVNKRYPCQASTMSAKQEKV